MCTFVRVSLKRNTHACMRTLTIQHIRNVYTCIYIVNTYYIIRMYILLSTCILYILYFSPTLCTHAIYPHYNYARVHNTLITYMYMYIHVYFHLLFENVGCTMQEWVNVIFLVLRILHIYWMSKPCNYLGLKGVMNIKEPHIWVKYHIIFWLSRSLSSNIVRMHVVHLEQYNTCIHGNCT